MLEGEGRVVGVVSEADLLPKEEFRDTDPDRYTQRQRLSDLAKAGAMTAEELMSAPAVTVRPGAPWPRRPASWPGSGSSVSRSSTARACSRASSAARTC